MPSLLCLFLFCSVLSYASSGCSVPYTVESQFVYGRNIDASRLALDFSITLKNIEPIFMIGRDGVEMQTGHIYAIPSCVSISTISRPGGVIKVGNSSISPFQYPILISSGGSEHKVTLRVLLSCIELQGLCGEQQDSPIPVQFTIDLFMYNAESRDYKAIATLTTPEIFVRYSGKAIGASAYMAAGEKSPVGDAEEEFGPWANFKIR